MNQLLDEYLINNKDKLDMDYLTSTFKVSVPTIYRHCKQQGLKLMKKKAEKTQERLNKIQKFREEGKTYQEIGDMIGISKQRVEQIIHGYN